MYRISLIFIACALLITPVYSQGQPAISLHTENTTLQTGHFYEVQIIVENMADLWLTDIEIAYDPAMLYIAGMTSGSPVTIGPLLAGDVLVPQNGIQDGKLQFTTSLINPTPPINGTGILASFIIYPLQAGHTQLTFAKADLISVSYVESTPQAPTTIEALPILLDLTLEGAPAAIPPESTATPQPTETPVPDIAPAIEESIAATNTPLPNVTRAPITETPANTTEQADTTHNTLMIAALILLLVTGVGLFIMLVIYLRRYRR